MPDLYPLLRPLLFRLDAERAHHLTLSLLKLSASVGLNRLAFPPPPAGKQTPVTVMGLTFPNRVGLAAGLDKTGECVAALGALGFGHIEVGTVTPRPQAGNPRPRLFRLIEEEAIINRMGFNNPGVSTLVANVECSRRGFHGILGINIGKNKDTPNESAADDYVQCLRAVHATADYVTVNLSSPNTPGLRDLQGAADCRSLILKLQEERQILASRQGGRRVPLALKIAPDLPAESLRELAEVFNETRLDAVIATNTTLDRTLVKGHPRAEEAGGLSGRPLTRRATETIERLRERLDPSIPIIGVGGISCVADAEEKLAAGASLVQIYSSLIFRGPKLVAELAAL
ncbi:MAG: quinone-dependent dihydroorotate dehydrogenase [Verrucomicrobiales bacterium]|nr:quinone-dependent dihydroorotate dehydrogenase [Verrucomicrobiae bacterium]MCP5554351.1 quinone-dependent dihydroorotate dehydrogenase [Akkermansiaceae bacterium]HRX56796.1 quinone-dependent dihydroorotate dehydrogenase [Verrucomicrobiales bacterium]